MENRLAATWVYIPFPRHSQFIAESEEMHREYCVEVVHASRRGATAIQPSTPTPITMSTA